MTELRFISYLAPSLPEALFETVCEHIGRAVGARTCLRFERGSSAPPEAETDPFSAGEADLAFLCAPGYARLSELVPAPVRLLPAAAVFDDPRTRGRPVYFSDVIVRCGAEPARFDDLRGRRWALNDPCSLSGYLCLLRRTQGDARFFAGACRSGSHIESVRLVARGEADAAAIDSNALALLLRREPELAAQIAVVESLGPHPIQPIVASARLSAELTHRIAEALCTMHLEAPVSARLRAAGVLRFVPVGEDDYAEERAAFRAWRSKEQAA